MAETRGFSADYSGAQTDAVVVAANANRTVQVRGVVLSCDATAKTVVFKSKPSGASTNASCTFQVPANGQLVLPPTTEGLGWFASKPGEGLTVTTTGAGALGVQVLYALI